MSTAVAAWARSGAMWLSGRPDGPPLLAPGDPAGAAERALARYAAATRQRTDEDADPELLSAGARLLGERAALLGLARNAPVSAGGAFRAVPTRDGWLGLSLARPDDLALVPALIEGPALGDDPWSSIAAWAADLETSAAAERGELLGLPTAAWPPAPPTRDPIRVTRGGRRTPSERPLVIDLTSLWAGPLCAHLLGLAGCRVVKVESSRRLDGARRGSAAFYELLHSGHESVTLDFTAPDDQRRLADLLRRADLVLEGSRPRALGALGIDAEAYVADGVSWLSITARGRDSDAVGFGDDVAVAAGLAVIDGPDLLPLGDALADPLTGLAAAAAAAEALLDESAALIDVSMLEVSRACVGPTEEAAVRHHGGVWWVDTAEDTLVVAPPSARPSAQHSSRTPSAAAPGEHNEVWLR